MNNNHRTITALTALIPLVASALIIVWLIRSSQQPDRPPMFAVVAFILAVAFGARGIMLGVRAAKG